MAFKVGEHLNHMGGAEVIQVLPNGCLAKHTGAFSPWVMFIPTPPALLAIPGQRYRRSGEGYQGQTFWGVGILSGDVLVYAASASAGSYWVEEFSTKWEKEG
jgi:hypothetical protein